MPKRRNNWIDQDEYPDERDIDEFGDDSPGDYYPLTIGRVGKGRRPYWTRGRIVIALIAGVLLFSLLLAEIMPLLQR